MSCLLNENTIDYYLVKLKNIIGPYSQRDFKSILSKHDFNDFQIGDKIDT